MAVADRPRITLSSDQERAADVIRCWLRGDNHETVFAGAAGTGKSTVLSYLYDELRESGTLFLCPSAKAAYVLQCKGVPAVTIHSAIFMFAGSYVNHRDDEVPIFNERDGIKCDSFVPKRLAIDEGSMIDKPTQLEIRSKELPMLIIGDSYQLAPVGEDAKWMHKPDVSLEKIHRQSSDSPILNLAHDVKNGKMPSMRHRSPGSVEVLSMSHPKMIAKHAIDGGYDQVICAFNNTRHEINRYMRQILGKQGLLDVGDKLICRFNARRLACWNGMQVIVERIISEDEKAYTCDLRIDLGGGVLGQPRKLIRVQKKSLDNPAYKTSERESGCVDFQHGYGITGHASQGSSWPKVLVVWQPSKQWCIKRWGYTVLTRPERSVGVCL